MTVASVASSNTKKLMKLTLSVFRPGFNSSKCKTAAKMAVARIKLLRNKREAVVRQMRRDIASLLKSGQDATARIRVEHVIREQNVLAANEFIELFCDLIVARITIIAKQRACPADLKKGIASLIFAYPRCSEIPELLALRKIFEKKYGRDFVSAAVDLRRNAGVKSHDKLSVRTPSGEVKLKVMKEIAKEYQIEWDTTESEKELLKAHEELIEGPRNFVSAASLPFEPATPKPVQSINLIYRSSNEERMTKKQFEDTASAAAEAAACAKQAIAVAEAAAFLASKDSNQASKGYGIDQRLNASSIDHGFEMLPGNSLGHSVPTDPRYVHHSEVPRRMDDPQDFDRSHYLNDEDTRTTAQMNGQHIYGRRHSYNETRPIQPDSEQGCRRHSYNETRPMQMDGQNVYRRYSYSASSPHYTEFDESDCDEEIEMEEPPSHLDPPKRSPPPVPSSHVQLDQGPQVHPKLPDYDALAARFEALKTCKS
ncbi:hypothetical protein Tsubulata_032957 [Turnera subulata]|uniref:IST1-like protein n=1 Tax=Turnera subulata TaxID=218843 RepID=A0A9Q0FKW8_9ROSI|nr:hypothetical protein Tsubulata_032957 [Turnera subulata]